MSNNVFGSQAFREAFEMVHYQEQMTRFRLESTWNQFFPAVMPIEVKLNPLEPTYDWVNNAEFGEILDEVFETGYVIPFIEALQQFLYIKNVYDAVLSSFKRNRRNTADPPPVNVFSDVFDAQYVKSQPMYIQHADKFCVYRFIWMKLKWKIH